MRILASLPLLLMSSAAIAQEPEIVSSSLPESGPNVKLSAGLEYETGDYGTGTNIDVISVPMSLRVSTGQLQLVAALPYRRVKAPANVVPGGLLGLPTIIDPTEPDRGRVGREGLGDLELGVIYTVPTNAVNLAFSGSVKLPTAGDNLGTGETDYTLGAEISQAIDGSATLFAGAAYTMPGDPEGYSLQDIYALTGGIAANLGSRTHGYVSYRYAQSASSLVADDQRATAGLTTGLGNRLYFEFYGAAGLSKGAPDLTTGLRIALMLD
jgi:hypothetical protein